MPSRSFTRAGCALGFALGGFFDGILLHQILQWHPCSRACAPASRSRARSSRFSARLGAAQLLLAETPGTTPGLGEAAMQVTVETDNHIENRDRLIAHVEGVVRDAVDRHEDRISFVEAHLGDVNGASRAGAADMRCMLQARIAGLKAVAVEHRAETLHLAIEGAAEKLTKALDTTFGKLEDRERRAQGTGEASAAALGAESHDAPETSHNR